MIWWFIFLAVILILVGIAYLRGKCDGFIAGYNTSSPEKQKQYDIKRLRLITACLHFALAAMLFLFLMKDADLAATIFLYCVVTIAITAVVLANTWAKKKRIK
ncbi:MAG: DUF3784 domain-containing protein [Bacteroidota bacterium]|nr:DUF3784 domain-containing protein [Bacteroidota bacterium]